MSRFVIASSASQLQVVARSTVHPLTYQASLTGTVEATVRDGGFDVAGGVTASLEVDLAGLRGSDPRADGEMRRRLDIGRHPRATAVVLDVAARGDDRYWLRGELSLHGATRPVAGGAMVTLCGDRLHAAGTVTIDIREFGIKPPSLLIVRVQPEVEITIDLVADLVAHIDAG